MKNLFNMMYNAKLLLVLLALGSFIFSCNRSTEISESNVSQIIQTLSADNMKGRYPFRPEIQLAIDFIANEFSSIGLSPLPGNTNFRQNFTIYSVKHSDAEIVVNGESLEDKNYFGHVLTEELNWNTEDVSIKYISRENNYRRKFQEYTNDDESSLIVVSTEHSKFFHRYRSYFTTSNRSFELDESPNDVFILIDEPVQDFEINMNFDVKSYDLVNIAGMIEGHRTNEIVLFSAHYDHIGVITPVDEDSVANGANDNASGVAGVIELARYYESRPKPERTLYFVAFSAEEAGGYGSKYFSRNIDPEQYIAMLNIEMIGKPAVEGPNTAWITGFDRSTLGEILQESTVISNFEFYTDPYPNQNLFYRSDNAPFAQLGIPAHSISTTPLDVDQDYHRVTDEFKTLHIPHTTNTIRAIAKASEAIAYGDRTPTRIRIDSEN